jgi:hypothetical protein
MPVPHAGQESLPVWHSSASLSGVVTIELVEQNNAMLFVKLLTSSRYGSCGLRLFNLHRQ